MASTRSPRIWPARGFAGLIVPDCPVDESGPLKKAADAAGLDLIALAAPTSGPERLRRIARASRGFVYLVPLTGLTGERTELPPGFVGWCATSAR
jgi:tryptophan synthase alpha chain